MDRHSIPCQQRGLFVVAAWGIGLLITVLMANLSPLIDSMLHPEIPYFDGEHLVVGGAAAMTTGILYVFLMTYVSGLRVKELEIRRLNEELELKVAEKTGELLEAQEELVLKEKLAMLGMIAGNMGNELRNPLGVMNNAVFFMKSITPKADETVREYLDIIENEITNSQEIISDLLDFCRITQTNAKPIPVHALIEQTLRGFAIPKNIRIHADLAEMPLTINIDPKQMGQVLRNLMTNAVQAMPDGGTLRVSAREVQGFKGKRMEPGAANNEQTGEFVEIAVTDTGAGIAPQNMDKLFQPLFTTKSRGIGLGLAISRKLAEANGGWIEAASEVGEGTTFAVVLPAKVGE